MNDMLTKIRILLSWLRHDYEQWRRDIWPEDLDARYCCDGRECGCFGMTLREIHCPKQGTRPSGAP